MSERQANSLGCALAAAWRAAAPLIAAALAAHVTVILMLRAAPVPLLTALAATVVFAGITFLYARRGMPIVPDASPVLALQAMVLAAVVIAAAVWLFSFAAGSGAPFYCEPLVPWRIAIALFGSFVLGYFTVMARGRPLGWAIYPVVMLALLWIAPFYGFFSPAVFLGISFTAQCPDRPMMTVVLTALGMIAGDQLGRTIAGWLSGGTHDGPGGRG